GAVTSCTTTAINNSVNASATDINEHFGATGKLLHQNFTENHNGASTGSLTSGASGYDWSGTLSPTVAPQITNFNPSSGPAHGFLPLSLFGIPLIAGTDDDTV